MAHLVKKSLILILAFLALFLINPTSINAKDHTDEHSGAHDEKEGFDAGSFIMDHIGDSHSWHIMTVGETHVSIPLPVIIYSTSEKNGGLHIFLSSKFHHGHASYDGFKIAESGDNKGKIVEELSDGSEVTPLDFSITKNVLSLFISLLIIVWIFTSIAKKYKIREGKAPKGIQSLLEPLILFIRDDVAKASIGEKKYERFLPFLLTIFFFIFFNNLLGIIPIFPGG
ncbi:MAG: F0F1 ATP synthase subunit A, partial [Marinilabiliales bacterium]